MSSPMMYNPMLVLQFACNRYRLANILFIIIIRYLHFAFEELKRDCQYRVDSRARTWPLTLRAYARHADNARRHLQKDGIRRMISRHVSGAEQAGGRSSVIDTGSSSDLHFPRTRREWGWGRLFAKVMHRISDCRTVRSPLRRMSALAYSAGPVQPSIRLSLGARRA